MKDYDAGAGKETFGILSVVVVKMDDLAELLVNKHEATAKKLLLDSIRVAWELLRMLDCMHVLVSPAAACIYIGVQSERIQTDIAHLVSYYIFFSQSESGTNSVIYPFLHPVFALQSLRLVGRTYIICFFCTPTQEYKTLDSRSAIKANTERLIA